MNLEPKEHHSAGRETLRSVQQRCRQVRSAAPPDLHWRSGAGCFGTGFSGFVGGLMYWGSDVGCIMKLYLSRMATIFFESRCIVGA